MGSVQSYNAYIHTWTNDIDGNGKPEFWVLADAYYNGIGITRITIFETNGNDSYQAVGKIDLVGVFSFYAGTMQAVDINNDGVEEIAVCIDDNFMIIKFNGRQDSHNYELYYLKQNELAGSGENSVYFGAIVRDLIHNGELNFMISMDQIIELFGNPTGRRFTQIYRPDSTTDIKTNNHNLNHYELYQNYPNPFNPSTKIEFQLPENSFVNITVYNTLGEKVEELVNSFLAQGKYSAEFNATNLPSGLYLYKIKAGNFSAVRKMVLTK